MAALPDNLPVLEMAMIRQLLRALAGSSVASLISNGVSSFRVLTTIDACIITYQAVSCRLFADFQLNQQRRKGLHHPITPEKKRIIVHHTDCGFVSKRRAYTLRLSESVTIRLFSVKVLFSLQEGLNQQFCDENTG